MTNIAAWISRNLRLVFWSFGTFAGLVQALAVRDGFYNDCIPYLSIAQVYTEKGWWAGINGFWSPLYSWTISPFLKLGLFKQDSELLGLHILMFFLFVATMGGFDFFLQTCLRMSRNVQGKVEEEHENHALFRALAYMIFLRLTLFWLPQVLTTPDLLVACFGFFTAGFLIRLNLCIKPFSSAIGFGLSLALGYLSKAAVFPLSLSLFVLLPAIAKAPRTRRVLLIAPAVFLVVTGPFLYSLSAKMGKLTFGESGRIAYLIYGNNYPPYWFGEDVGGSPSLRGFQRIDTDPSVLVFDSPVIGSYYPSYDPSVWYKDIPATVHVRNELHILRESVKEVGAILGSFTEIPAALIALACLFPRDRWKTMLQQCWFLLFPALLMLGMYSLVHVDERFVAGFIVIFWVAALRAVTSFGSSRDQPIRPILFGLLFVLAIGFIFRTSRETISAFFLPHPPPAVIAVESLDKLGVARGSKIAVLGTAFDLYIARVGRYSIVASIPPSSAGAYFVDDSRQRGAVDRALVDSGAVALIMHSPGMPPQQNWKNIPGTDLYVKLLAAVSNSSPLIQTQ